MNELTNLKSAKCLLVRLASLDQLGIISDSHIIFEIPDSALL